MPKKNFFLLNILIITGMLFQVFSPLPTFASSYIPQAVVTSANLLAGTSASIITNFHYNLSTLPASSSVRIQFSKNNTSWYSSAGTLNAWDTLSTTGGADINLTAFISGSSWTTGNDFYYKFEINSTSDLTQAPTIDDVRLDYTATNGYERSFIFDNNGNVGIGTTTPTNILSLGNNQNQKFWIENSASGTVGRALTVAAGGTLGGASNVTGGNLILQAGLGTGTGASTISFQTGTTLSSGTSLQTMSTKMTILGNGEVGIGTTTPAVMLQVGSNINPGNVRIDSGWLCVDSDGTCTGAGAAGTIYAANSTVVGGADYAEYFYTRDTNLQAGEAVCVDLTVENGVKRCQNDGDNNIMGIVSAKPSIIGNKNADQEKDPDHYKIIGMLGQVAGKVSNENGDIKVGDSLTAGVRPGELRKANAGESTVGIALENSLNINGTIQVLISRRNQSLTVEKVQQAVTENIATMNIKDKVDVLVSKASAALDNQLSGQTATLVSLQTQSEDAKKITDKLQAQIDDIKLQNKTLGDFIAILDPKKMIYKDSLGNLDLLGGKLIASGIETGMLTIKVADSEKSTIGQIVICPANLEADKSNKCTVAQTDADHNGLDDNTHNAISDGKGVEIKTSAVGDNSNIFLTPEGDVGGRIWVEKVFDDEINSFTGFKIKCSDILTRGIKINWWIVDSEK